MLDPGPKWVIASLRTGCLPLRNEIGALPNPLGQRVCLLCNEGAVEDEYHFVISFIKLTKERNKTISNIISLLMIL